MWSWGEHINICRADGYFLLISSLSIVENYSNLFNIRLIDGRSVNRAPWRRCGRYNFARRLCEIVINHKCIQQVEVDLQLVVTPVVAACHTPSSLVAAAAAALAVACLIIFNTLFTNFCHLCF